MATGEDEGGTPKPRWVFPVDARAQVAQRLDKKTFEAEAVVIDWAMGDLVTARAARVLTLQEGVTPHQEDNVIMKPSFWASLHNGHGDTDWEAAIFSARTYKANIGRSVEYRAYGVQFDEVDLERQLPPVPEPTPLQLALREALASAAPSQKTNEAHESPVTVRPKPDLRPRLSDAEMDKFSRMILETYGDAATEARVHKAISGMFSEKAVPRDYFLGRFRAIRGDKKPGRTNGSGKSNG